MLALPEGHDIHTAARSGHLLGGFWTPSDTLLCTRKSDPEACPQISPSPSLSPQVKFSPVPEGESGLHLDPLTKDTFTNASKLVVLRTTGEVRTLNPKV